MSHSNSADAGYTAAEQALSHARAAGQGLVCLICGRAPGTQGEGGFHDAGLCSSCAAEIGAEDLDED
jgi:hypothetical protein